MLSFTTGEINQEVNGILTGDPGVLITGVDHIGAATANQLTFIGSKKYVGLWETSKAAAAIVKSGLGFDPGQDRTSISVDDADLALAQVLQMFAPPPPICEQGRHSSAVIDETATIGQGACIGAGCYIGPNVLIGARAKLYPNVTVLDDSSIGDETVIWSGTVIRERCRIGKQCLIHPNVTIGADGFGYRPAPDGRSLVKIPQIGTVDIGDGVEIGAGSCVDRGKFSATSIGDGTKIDNLVQIAHNCSLGRSCVMAGQSGLAGSVTLGDGVIMGGRAIVSDHLSVGSGTKIGGNAGVISDIPPGKTVLGLPADDFHKTMRQWASLKQLPDLIKQIKKMDL